MTDFARHVSIWLGLGLLLQAVGCGADVGDSSAGPGLMDVAVEALGADDTSMASPDAPVPFDGGSEGSLYERQAEAADAAPSAPPTDSQVDQSVQPEIADANGEDVRPDAASDHGESSEEAGPPDVSTADAADASGVVDALSDSTVEAIDSGTLDANADTQSEDAESGAHVDGGNGADASESGAEAGALAPCTMAAQTNCVKCDGNSMHGNVCTQTEALIVQRDIAKGFLMGDVPDPTTSCYECMVRQRCIDSDLPKTGQECEDLTGTVGAGAQASETKKQACLNTLQCVLTANCGNAPNSAMPPDPNDGISNCYCGTAFPTASACSGASGTALTGVCRDIELDGFGDTASTAPAMVLSSYTLKTSGSGMANALLKCAGTNTGLPACPMCYQ